MTAKTGVSSLWAKTLEMSVLNECQNELQAYWVLLELTSRFCRNEHIWAINLQPEACFDKNCRISIGHEFGNMYIYWPFFTQVSGRNLLPEICGEVHPKAAPLQALCCGPCSTEQSTFWGGDKAEKAPRKGEQEGWPAKGAKRKKGRVKTGQNSN